MASLPATPPKYRHYRPKDLAVVRIDGRDRYLGKYGSPESHEKYGRLVAEWQASRPSSFPGPAPREAGALSVSELMLAYWERRVFPYYVKDGRPTSEQSNIAQALRFVRILYAHTPARDFGPLALKVVRKAMVDAGRSRRLINKDVHRIRGMFKWAAGEELFPGEALVALAAVAGLEKGRSDAKESEPVRPVDESAVEATVRHLSAPVAAMVRLQLLTAASRGRSAPSARATSTGPGRCGSTGPSRTRRSTTGGSG